MLPFPVSILVIEQNGFGGEKKTLLFGDRTEQWIKKSVLDVIGAFLELMKTKRVLLYFGKKKKELRGKSWTLEHTPGANYLLVSGKLMCVYSPVKGLGE